MVNTSLVTNSALIIKIRQNCDQICITFSDTVLAIKIPGNDNDKKEDSDTEIEEDSDEDDDDTVLTPEQIGNQ